MKLCTDCKHYRNSWIDFLFSPFVRKYAKCAHPLSIGKRSDVVINGYGSGYYCSNMRLYDCSMDAVLFEAKEKS